MARDWAESDYTRIYHSVMDDPKFAEVYDDDRRWAAYTRLLLAADASFPSPAALPRWLDDDVLEHLVGARIIELVRGSSYRIVALKAEREGRLGGKQIGGKVRAEVAERDEHGRFLPRTGDEPVTDPASRPAPASKPQHPASTGGPADSQESSVAEDKPRIDETRFSSSERAGDREDVAALKARGWAKVTKAQRAVLDEIAERHDQTGYAFAAEAIRATPDGKDPLEAVMAADRMWQTRQRQQSDQADEAWQRTKAEERDLGQVPADVKAWIS